MNREALYFISDKNGGSTFQYDETLPNLPLPKLKDSLERYYQSLLPFGNAEELQHSRQLIEQFKQGVGRKLQEILEARTKIEKNWVEKWWEEYAYLTTRAPLTPFATMVQPLLIEAANIEVSTSYRLKAAARITYHLIELWNLLRMEQLKPATNADRSTIYSNFLYRRAYNTVREPGELMDKIKCYFKTISEGECSSYIILIGKGRMFYFSVKDKNGHLLTVQHYLKIFERLAKILNESPMNEFSVPVLTCEDRTKWAQNRQYLKELSPTNSDYIDKIEQSIMSISFDNHYPENWSEISLSTLCGDIHSRWADKCSSMVTFDNGKFGFTGEHSCYDGSISINNSTFVLLSLMETSEPDWNAKINDNIEFNEIIFDLDDHIRMKINEAIEFTNISKKSITVSSTAFTGFGRNQIKSLGFNPDTFIQLVLQLTYFNMHKEFVPTYETALMRHFYNGRTETVRSCTVDSVNWVTIFINKNETNEKKLNAFKIAAKTHTNLMNLARSGNGIDRHLFGLWCAAYEADLEIPELYNDPLYTKSGGGGNFVLSTSTLGYSINNGLVAPMCVDGYAIFYSMTQENVWLNVAVLRNSTKTSAHRFAVEFENAMLKTRDMIKHASNSKL